MSDDYPEPVGTTRYRCIGCGYELSGSAIGGFCPECGRPVEETLRVASGHQAHNSTTSTSAIIGLVLGIVGLVSSCVILSPFAIWLYYRTRDEVARGQASQDSLALAMVGLVLGWIGTVLLIGGCCFSALWFFLAAGLATI